MESREATVSAGMARDTEGASASQWVLSQHPVAASFGKNLKPHLMGTPPRTPPAKGLFSQEEMGCAGFQKVGAGRALATRRAKPLTQDQKNGGPERMSEPP